MARNYRYISADSHFESPPEQWTHRVPKQYRDRAPRRIKLANGRDALQVEGHQLIYGGTSQYGGKPPETFDPTIMEGTYEMRLSSFRMVREQLMERILERFPLARPLDT